MDLSFLDKSSGVTPLLVRLYDSHKLLGLAKDRQPLARAELVSAVSDLLGMELSPRETELVSDVLIALMRQAEKDLRQALAERLSVIDNVPLRLILQIANDEIDIAAPVLRNSNVLGDMDLIYIIKSRTAAHWQAIATRAKLSEHVMNVLAETKEIGTALALAENMNITLTERTLTVLSDIAQGNEDLAGPLLRRDEVSDELAGKLYKYVGAQLKRYIAQNYAVKSELLAEAIDEIIFELAEEPSQGEFMPTASMIKAAERFRDKGLLTAQMMIGTLKRGQTQSFIAQFAKFTGLTPETIISILHQPTGQGLAVACKAFGIIKTDFVSLFLLTNRIRSREKMVDVKDINSALGYYDRIKQDIALDIIRNS